MVRGVWVVCGGLGWGGGWVLEGGGWVRVGAGLWRGVAGLGWGLSCGGGDWVGVGAELWRGWLLGLGWGWLGSGGGWVVEGGGWIGVGAGLWWGLGDGGMAGLRRGEALYALKLSLDASASQLGDWNPNMVNPCTWSNVICDPNNNVVSLALSSMGFNGSLSPRIGILSTLATLSLQGNSITGKIPEELGNLSSLTSLDLENNRLTGDIPSSLGNLRNLKYLILNDNELSGTIPDSLSSLDNLISLQLSSNQLSGQVPDQLFQVSQYNFSGNKLSCGDLHHPCASDGSGGGSSKKTKVGVIAGVVGGIVSVLLLGGFILFICRNRITGYKREIFVDVPGSIFLLLYSLLLCVLRLFW
ncbi:LRR receptor kinase SERK2 [Bienertia sinuspersici]